MAAAAQNPEPAPRPVLPVRVKARWLLPAIHSSVRFRLFRHVVNVAVKERLSEINVWNAAVRVIQP